MNFKMNNNESDTEWNHPQCPDTLQLLDEYRDKLSWRLDGQDSLMDIGCGAGFVTLDFILPILPTNFERLIGIDKSDKAISLAKERNSEPKIEFKQFDIVTDNIDRLPKVDHITSFYCLNWIQAQKKAIQNIFNLLKQGGDCLLVVAVDAPCFCVLQHLASDSKWGKYMKDGSKYISPNRSSKNPDIDFEHMLRDCLFSSYHVEIREMKFEFDHISQMKGKKSLILLTKFIICVIFKRCRPFENNKSIQNT